ncbi:hypothetical protein LSH36_127g14012 [Paralvinella palmiformis]|uniref:Uncharacterized protein n=1 Tax=Paralvinella palmiformis TaxID=53620 RepID=A0AAD9JX85_9ANNE|nr:hypothetical protein LSH36_127g14012 [Paralvinella palmiformis]
MSPVFSDMEITPTENQQVFICTDIYFTMVPTKGNRNAAWPELFDLRKEWLAYVDCGMVTRQKGLGFGLSCTRGKDLDYLVQGAGIWTILYKGLGFGLSCTRGWDLDYLVQGAGIWTILYKGLGFGLSCTRGKDLDYLVQGAGLTIVQGRLTTVMGLGFGLSCTRGWDLDYLVQGAGIWDLTILYKGLGFGLSCTRGWDLDYLRMII